MRLAGQAKLGYYPIPPEVIDLIAKHLHTQPLNPEKRHDTVQILDPCAGEGKAIQQLGHGLGVPEDHIYTVELDSGRSNAIRELMPASKHIGPATFLDGGSQITGYSFGLTYVNPPFDDQLGGGNREELNFVKHATTKLVYKGVMVLVCPITALSGNRKFCEFVDSNYEHLAVYAFPEEYRHFKEIIVIGSKRRESLSADNLYAKGTLHLMQFNCSGYISVERLPTIGDVQPVSWSSGVASWTREAEIRRWEIPTAWKPHVFKKTMFTDEELYAEVVRSPLGKHLQEVVIPPPSAPPLPLDRGHLGLVLASGILDGYVDDPFGGHVVRGRSHKVEYHNKAASTSEVNPDTKAVTTKEVISERPVTVIRAVDRTGEIQTYSNDAKKDEDDDDFEPDADE